MLELGDFAAYISVDGKELAQYGSEVLPGEGTVTCWVASEAGKKFSVAWKRRGALTAENSITTGIIFLDGVHGGTRNIKQQETEVQRNYVSVSEACIQYYTFASVELTDDDRFLHSARSQDIGQIRLEVWKGEETVRKPRGFRPSKLSSDKVHERSKKIATHRIKLSEETQRKPRRQSSTVVTRLGSKPLVTFVFNYRPKDLLIANGIIQSAKLTQSKNIAKGKLKEEKDRGEEDAVSQLESQLLECQSQMQSIQSTLQSLKRGLSTSVSPRKKVKRESIAFNSDEVIDLT